MKTDVIEKMKYIESRYPVETIEYDGIKLWPFFRVNIYTLYYYSDRKTNLSVVASKYWSRIYRIFLALKYTSLRTLLKKKSALFFTDDLEIKQYDVRCIDRTMQDIMDIEPKKIVCITKLFYRKLSMPFNYINMDLFLLIIFIISRFSRLNQSLLKGEEILKSILKLFDIKFNYHKNIKWILSSLIFFNWYFVKIQPVKLYINCYYDISKMCASFVAKKNGIPVIEVQHGLISASHIAYTAFQNINENPYPNYLFIFGEKFKQYISSAIYSKKSIYIVGRYYINLVLQDKQRSLELFHNKYPNIKDKIIITVASQYDIDREILDFTMQTASMDKRFFFIFIPRFIKDYHKKFKHANISIETELDVYQCMQNSHITSAVVSTCAVESLAFGTPTVLINIGGLAVFNYADFFSEIHSVLYADTPDEYVQQIYKAIAFDRVSVAEEGKLFFADNYSERLKDAIIKIESKHNDLR